MDKETDSFSDYLYRGIGAFLRFTSKAGDTLRVASGNAIEKLDAFQLERRRERLYTLLGRTVHKKLSSGQDVVGDDEKISVINEEITAICAELDRRLGSSAANKK